VVQTNTLERVNRGTTEPENRCFSVVSGRGGADDDLAALRIVSSAWAGQINNLGDIISRTTRVNDFS